MFIIHVNPILIYLKELQETTATKKICLNKLYKMWKNIIEILLDFISTMMNLRISVEKHEKMKIIKILIIDRTEKKREGKNCICNENKKNI